MSLDIVSVIPYIRLELFLYSILFVYLTLSFALPIFLYYKKVVSGYFVRKFIHFFAGVSVVLIPFFQYPLVPILFSGLLALLMYLAGKKTQIPGLRTLYKIIGEDDELKLGYLQGPFAYAFSIMLSLLLVYVFNFSFVIPVIAIFIMIISDTLASVVGKRYGRIRFLKKVTGSNRSLIGSATFLVTSFLLTFFLLNVHGLIYIRVCESFCYIPNNFLLNSGLSNFLIAALLSVFSTLIEMFSPSKWDDFLVPIGTTIVLMLLI
ncbi:MAG: hypothetical protein R3B92_04550 [Patescibacteria group bacterium]